MDIKELDILGQSIETHWYYRSKARAVRHLLENFQPRSILDIGAGSGFFSRDLLRHTSARQAWCIDTSYLADSDETDTGGMLFKRRSITRSEADLVLMMDVLEHVDDDIGLLRDYAEKVATGTRFLISVPAFQSLWSGHDEFLEHKRRYSLAQLESTIRTAGLHIDRSHYFYAGVLPLAIVVRLWQRLRGAPKGSQLQAHHPLINALLTIVCQLELPLTYANRIAGLTVFCLAQKRQLSCSAKLQDG